jgi:hypothetical protein
LKHVPKTACLLLAALGVGVALGVAYSLRVNPELAFFRAGAEAKDAWSARIDAEHEHKIILFGGSSCTTTVVPSRMLEAHGLPVVNAGLGAGMGPRVLARYALSLANEGDILVAAFEPELLDGALESPLLGAQFSMMRGSGHWLDPSLESEPHRPGFSEIVELRPGGYHAFTLLGKITAGRPLYRYTPGEFQPDGWQNVAARMPIAPAPAREKTLSAAARDFLEQLVAVCAERKLRLALTLPWFYVAEEHAEAERRFNVAFLAELSEIVPTLDDGATGVWTVEEDFADTPFHLVPAAAEHRSDQLAIALKEHFGETLP